MSFYEIIKSLELSYMGNRDILYERCKPMSSYVSNLSKYKKDELKNLIISLNNYNISVETQSNTYKFDNKNIILDDEQYEIVKASANHNMRVLAGAGSGKTTTILCRVKYLLDNFITPERILILTFNKDACENLKSRIKSLFGFDLKIQIYTIDAFCYKLMNMYGQTNKIFSLSEYSNEGLKLMKLFGKEISEQYKYIFFDEFQDVNTVQFEILRLFYHYGCYLTVIGDDSQNIYQFRGTDNYYIINFDNIFKNTKTYKMTTNYRSTKSIVDIANKSISHNINKVDKVMKPCNEIIQKPYFVICENDYYQSKYIIRKIKKFLNDGYKYDDIAILSRNGYYLKMLETVLTKHEIPHIACITDKTSDDNKKILEKDKIALTTIHKSKGLEWQIVFIIGFSDEFFPIHMNNNIKNIEEERRLFYVGITRSKEKLFLLSSLKEVPLSRFVKEIYDDVVPKTYPLKLEIPDKLFDYNNDSTAVKNNYSVHDLLSLLSAEYISDMRECGLIPEIIPIEERLFMNDIKFTNKIKSGAYESDFGEFCDRYITRGIIREMFKKHPEIKYTDKDTEDILNALILNNHDMELYNKYNLEALIKKDGKIKTIPTVNTNDKLRIIDICRRINEHFKKHEKTNNMEILRVNTYPEVFLNELRASYKQVINLNLTNNDVLENIYYISLCRNFKADRRRLAYRDIYNIIYDCTKEGVLNRMDEYIELNKNKSIICKKLVSHIFTTKTNIVSIGGEIDLINIDDGVLIDIKCSESKYKLEWYLQLLLYYSLMNDEYRKRIKYFGIFNVMSGVLYKCPKPEAYDCEALIAYYENIIINDQNSIRNIANKNNIAYEFEDNLEEYKEIIHKVIEKKNEQDNNLSLVFDTETTDFNGDIIQMAYIIMNEKNEVIKEFNKYVKDRIPSNSSKEIHKIDIDKLRKEGIDFYDIMREFIGDLERVYKVIGHNVQFDIKMVKDNLKKFDIKYNGVLFDDKKIICTKKMANGLSLENLYKKLFNDEIVNAHDALGDVMTTYLCYTKMICE